MRPDRSYRNSRGLIRTVALALEDGVYRALAALVGWLAVRTRRAWDRQRERLPRPLRRICEACAAWVERRDRYFRRSLVASGAIHLAALLIFTFVPTWSQEIKWVRPPLVVSLVDLPQAKPKAAAPKAPSKPKQKPKESPKKPTPKKPVKKETPKKPPPKKPEEEAPRVPETPRPKAAVEPEATPDSVAVAPAASSFKVIAQVDEAGFAYDYYLQIVVGKASEAWMPPAGVTGRDQIPEAVLCFRIDRGGQVRVSSVGIEESSGLELFDRSAREAVLHAQPFPPLPPAYGGRWLTVHLRFTLSEAGAASGR